MLDRLKGFSLVFMIVLLSLVFVLQFGGSQAEGCTSKSGTYVAKIGDTVVNAGDVYANYVLAGFDRMSDEERAQQNVRQVVLDGIIERTLLAEEARRVGLEVSQEEVMKNLAEDGSARMTLRSRSNEITLPVKDENGNFDLEYAKRFIQNGMRRSVKEFGEAQGDELLAERMRALVTSSVAVSDAEVWQSYAQDNDNAQIEYVRFSPLFYERAQKLDKEAASARAKAEAQKVLKVWRNATSSDATKKDLDRKAAKAGDENEGFAPTLKESGSFGWGDSPITGAKAGRVVESAMTLDEGQSFPGEPVAAGDDWVVYKLVERNRPDPEALSDEERVTRRENLREQKGQEAVQLLISSLRKKAIEDGTLSIAQVAAPTTGS